LEAGWRSIDRVIYSKCTELTGHVRGDKYIVDAAIRELEPGDNEWLAIWLARKWNSVEKLKIWAGNCLGGQDVFFGVHSGPSVVVPMGEHCDGRR
jgi:hypothetical protein